MTTTAFQHIHVLLAFGEPMRPKRYCDDLERKGFRVSLASSGLECLNCLRCDSPDVLVLGMPLLWGGSEGILALMQDDPELPIIPILLFGKAEDGVISHRVGERAKAFWIEPSEPEELTRQIRRFLRVARVEAELLLQGDEQE